MVDNGKGGTAPSVHAAAVFRKVHWALLPLFSLIAAACYIDRTNLAFASIPLNHDLGFNAQVYGLGSGLFFLGYSLFMVPSNLAMLRVGPPRWLGILVTLWGAVAACFAALSSATQFFWLRFLLGAVEAGAFPGMWYYLYLFYPVDLMTLPLAVIEAAVASANVLSAPLAAGLLLLQGSGGMAGWQWLFLVEGLATMALGCATASLLPHSLASATFLSGPERHWLMQRLEQQQQQQQQTGGGGGGGCRGDGDGDGNGGGDSNVPGGNRSSAVASGSGGGRKGGLLAGALLNGRVWYVALMGLIKNIASNGILFWAPIINEALLEHRDMDPAVHLGSPLPRGRATLAMMAAATPPAPAGGPAAGPAGGAAGGGAGVSVAAVLLSGIPFGCAAVMSLWLGRRSQAKRERALHLAVPYSVSALLLASLPRLSAASPALAFAAVALAVACVMGTNSIINSYVPVVAAGPSVPVAMALYNAISNLGGLLGPWVIGELVWRTGGYGDAFRALGAFMGIAGVMAWGTQRWTRTGTAAAAGDGCVAVCHKGGERDEP